MQRVDLTETSDFKLRCPFCGSLTISPEGTSQCEHVLFLATDEGFEFVNAKSGLNILECEESIDKVTDAIQFPGSIKFAIYQPAPSLFGAYVGFARRCNSLI